jgi:hypothetical protein
MADLFTRVASLDPGNGWVIAGSVLLLLLSLWLARRAWRALVTLRARALTPVAARKLSHLLRPTTYRGDVFFAADGAGAPWVAHRKRAFERLAERLRQRGAKSGEWGRRMRGSLSDLRFTDSNRVPFPFAPVMRESFELASMVTASNGPELLDLDGNWSLDVGGSYGVNVCGYEQYKEWIERGWQKVKDLGPVLGPLHPVVGENVEMLKAISGKDEVSFHMSGTEAVMAAVRLARFNTGRKHIVAFSGAYHGWWDGVQPGLAQGHPRARQADRRRAGEPGAILPSQRAAAQRRGADDVRDAPHRRGHGRLRHLAAAAAPSVPRVRRAVDLRRGLQRLSARPRRRAGALRHRRRHGGVRQDRGRRAADRRGVRPRRPDAALRSVPPDAHRVCRRDVLRPSARDGGDE